MVFSLEILKYFKGVYTLFPWFGNAYRNPYNRQTLYTVWKDIKFSTQAKQQATFHDTKASCINDLAYDENIKWIQIGMGSYDKWRTANKNRGITTITS